MIEQLTLQINDDKSLIIAGIDEAGRGPLAGPVFAAAVILDPHQQILDLNDSKKLSVKKRNELAILIKEKALSWSIASASVEEIDSINILQATFLAMTRAWKGLTIHAQQVFVDGNKVPPKITSPAQAIIKGDSKIAAIAAASILAKTARDKVLINLHSEYPEYEFNKHKGYATKLHLEKISKYGPCPAHRKTFKPISQLI